jgi:mannose/fructose/N-acetylgalactosamine-specific phosphotransferase system component IID
MSATKPNDGKEGEVAMETEGTKKVSEEALYGALWRVNNFAGNYNNERLMSLGMCEVMVPIFRSLKVTGDQLKEGLTRHMVFYNTNPYPGAMIMGIMAAMEEAKANDESFPPETINDFKVAMMGPFAGMGDSFFWGTLHPIILVMAASWAVHYNILGFFFSYLIAVEAIVFTVLPFFWGYRFGASIVDRIRNSQIFGQLVTGAKVVAMTVVGVMIATLMHISTPIVLFANSAKGSGVNIQSTLDGMMPGLLNLGVLFLAYWLLRKKISPVVVMLILMVLTVGVVTLGWVN